MNRRLSRSNGRTAMAAVLAAMAGVMAGCGAVGPATMTSAAPTPTPPAAQSPTLMPPSASPTSTAAPTPTQTPAQTPAETEVGPPAIGSIGAPDGTGMPGSQGSWCYDGTCLDGPPAPKGMLPLVEAAAGAALDFTIAESHKFNHWSVSYQATVDEPAVELASGGARYDPDLSSSTLGPLLSSFTFDGPPAGNWMLSVSLQFADRGSGIYYWQVVSPG